MQQTNVVANVRNEITTMIESRGDDLIKLLPSNMTKDKFIRITFNQFNKNPKLFSCSKVSIVDSVMCSAELGLYPSSLTGHAYLVPYSDQCQLQVGYQGYIELAKRSGYYSSIICEAVYEKDAFEYVLGSNPKIKHIPSLKDRGNKIGYYAIAFLKEGSNHLYKFMTIEEIESYRPKIKRNEKYDFWVNYPEQMHKKTVIKQLLKFAFKDAVIQRAVEIDTENENIINAEYSKQEEIISDDKLSEM